MQIRRTANAGVLLTLDGTKVLLDGVCPDYDPYLGTPEALRQALLQADIHALAFTHYHPDHCDRAFIQSYTAQTHRPVLGPVGLPQEGQTYTVEGLRLTAVPSRHIGATWKNTPHVSYCVEGNRCVWFMGDASPLQFRDKLLPRPDVLIVPFAYAATDAAWSMVRSSGARQVILLHMPDPAKDSYGIWEAVKKTTDGFAGLCIPEMGQTVPMI